MTEVCMAGAVNKNYRYHDTGSWSATAGAPARATTAQPRARPPRRRIVNALGVNHAGDVRRMVVGAAPAAPGASAPGSRLLLWQKKGKGSMAYLGV
jgi:hypothetical protein